MLLKHGNNGAKNTKRPCSHLKSKQHSRLRHTKLGFCPSAGGRKEPRLPQQ